MHAKLDNWCNLTFTKPVATWVRIPRYAAHLATVRYKEHNSIKAIHFIWPMATPDSQ